jgi:hypothetical protein
MMSLLIPWEQIIALGAIEESNGLKPGFAALAVDDVEATPHDVAARGVRGNPL